jgi:hypothetical protein
MDNYDEYHVTLRVYDDGSLGYVYEGEEYGDPWDFAAEPLSEEDLRINAGEARWELLNDK